MKRLVCLVLAAALLAAGCGSSSPTLPASLPAVTVPLTVQKDSFSVSLFVPVTLGNHHYLFQLDTGAAASVIRPAVAKAAHIETSKHLYQGHAVGCPFSYRAGIAENWSLGENALDPALIAVQNQTGIPNRVDGQPVGGVLGSDVVSTFGRVTLEIPSHKLVLGGSAALPHPVNATVFKSGSQRAFVIPVNVSGHHVRFLLDTGASVTAVSDALSHSAKLIKLGKGGSSSGATGCNEQSLPVGLVAWAADGTLLPRTVAVAGNFPHTLSKSLSFDGLFGSDVLSTFDRVVLDYAHGKLSLIGPRLSASKVT